MRSTSLVMAARRPTRCVPTTTGATHAAVGSPVVGRRTSARGRSGEVAVAFPG